MATKTFYTLNTTAVTPNWYGNLQEGGSVPPVQNSAYGWTVAKTSVSTPYWRARLGATALATVSSSTSNIAAAAGPLKGGGATNTTAGDSFATSISYNGVFAAGNWTFNFGMRAGTATSTGRMRLRVWASTSADGLTAPRELTSGVQVGSIVTMSATGTTYTSTITWNAPQITLVNEYLFFQLEWEETTAGNSNSSSVVFYQSAATIVTTDFGLPTTNKDSMFMVM